VIIGKPLSERRYSLTERFTLSLVSSGLGLCVVTRFSVEPLLAFIAAEFGARANMGGVHSSFLTAGSPIRTIGNVARKTMSMVWRMDDIIRAFPLLATSMPIRAFPGLIIGFISLASTIRSMQINSEGIDTLTSGKKPER